MDQPSAAPPVAPAAAPPKKGGVLKLAMIVVVLVALGVGGYIFVFKKGAPAGAKKGGSVTGQAQAEEEVPEDLHYAQLSPLIINLADKDTPATIKIGISLGFSDKALAMSLEKKEPHDLSMIQDVLLTILSSKTAAQILTKEGKEALKKEILAGLNKAFKKKCFYELFFTEFYIQQ